MVTASQAGLDRHRFRILNHVMHRGSVEASWADVVGTLREAVSDSPTATDVIELGDVLSDAFRSARGLGRSQSGVSAGGVVWESLVTWYLNLVSFGTSVIASPKHQQFVPKVLSDAVSVNIRGYQVNTESDVFVWTMPEGVATEGDPDVSALEDALRRHRSTESLYLVQCKTNWNDNAQTPMVWDIIYRSLAQQPIPGVSVGSDNVSLSNFHRSGYAFVTVPTNDASNFTSDSLPVIRLSGLSAHNYWGRPAVQGVARGFSSFLNDHFAARFRGGVDAHLERQLRRNPDLVRLFFERSFALR